MTTTRLRKAFQYPANNSDDDDVPRDLDEQEQEKLISELRQEEDERNEEHKRILLAIPLVSAMAFLPALIMSQLLQAKLVALLAMTSLVATAYILMFLPVSKSEPANYNQIKRRFEPEPGPLRRFLPYLNGGLSLLIGVHAVTFKNKPGVHDGLWVLCVLPAVALSITLVARRFILSVDVELGELERLQYGYKGA